MPAHLVHAHHAVEIFYDRPRRAPDAQRNHCRRDSHLHSTRSTQFSNHVSTALRVAFHGHSRIPLQLGVFRRFVSGDYLLPWTAENTSESLISVGLIEVLRITNSIYSKHILATENILQNFGAWS